MWRQSEVHGALVRLRPSSISGAVHCSTFYARLFRLARREGSESGPNGIVHTSTGIIFSWYRTYHRLEGSPVVNFSSPLKAN